MTYEEQSASQADALSTDISSRILKDVNRKQRVIVLIPGTATVTVDYPKITVTTEDDLLRVAAELLTSGLCLVQAEGSSIITVENFAQIVHARIYALTDLPDLSILPVDQMLLNKHEQLSYHQLPTLLDHLRVMNANSEQTSTIKFDEVGNGS